MEIYVWKNKAFLVEHVQMKATDKLYHGTPRECQGASVKTGMYPTDYSDTHVAAGVQCLSFAE